MKKAFTLLFVFAIFAGQNLYSQSQSDSQNYFETDSEQDVLVPENSIESTLANKIDWGLTAGTSIGSFGEGALLSTFVAPHLKYKYSPKFTISTGIMFANSTANNLYMFTPDGIQSMSGNIIENYVYASGDYLVNERLRIRGTIMYEMNHWYETDSDLPINQNNTSFSFGAEYRLTENITIGVQVQQRKQPSSPYGLHPIRSNNPYLGW